MAKAATIKVKLLHSLMVGGGTLAKGQVVEVHEKVGRSWVAGGQAVLVDEPKAPAGKGK